MTEDKVAEDLLDTAFDVARRYKSFGSYGSEAKAIRALQRRRPKASGEECKGAFERASDLFEATVEVCAKHKDDLLAAWQGPENAEVGNMVDTEVSLRCPGVRLSTCHAAWNWIFYWYYLR